MQWNQIVAFDQVPSAGTWSWKKHNQTQKAPTLPGKGPFVRGSDAVNQDLSTCLISVHGFIKDIPGRQLLFRTGNTNHLPVTYPSSVRHPRTISCMDHSAINREGNRQADEMLISKEPSKANGKAGNRPKVSECWIKPCRCCSDSSRNCLLNTVKLFRSFACCVSYSSKRSDSKNTKVNSSALASIFSGRPRVWKPVTAISGICLHLWQLKFIGRSRIPPKVCNRAASTRGTTSS